MELIGWLPDYFGMKIFMEVNFLQELFKQALAEAQRLGASYADVRLVDRHKQPIMVANGRISNITSSESKGVGVRVMVNGAWGFSASAEINENNFWHRFRKRFLLPVLVPWYRLNQSISNP